MMNAETEASLRRKAAIAKAHPEYQMAIWEECRAAVEEIDRLRRLEMAVRTMAKADPAVAQLLRLLDAGR